MTTTNRTTRWVAYWRLMRFDRPIGILLLLWPTWWALVLAGNGRPTVRNILIFTAGVVLMRAAGCVMNDIADRDFDPHVERTRERPLATGEVQLKEAIDGCLASPFHLAGGHLDIELICRDQQHVERYRAMRQDTDTASDSFGVKLDEFMDRRPGQSPR